ncbi:MAG: hypothetical protein ACLPN6_15015 [Streptosporangiaceae bacterium]
MAGGGAITIAIALSWSRFFPALARVDRMQDVRPAAAAPAAAAPGPPGPAGSAEPLA